jgi:carboxylesterase
MYLLPIVKYLVRQLPKAEDYFTDPQAKARHWNYKTWPTAASHEGLKLIGEVKRLLPQIICPLLVIYSTEDPLVPPESARFVYDRVGSTDKELVMLHNSGHILTLDSEWELVAEKTHQFIQDHLPAALEANQEQTAV